MQFHAMQRNDCNIRKQALYCKNMGNTEGSVIFFDCKHNPLVAGSSPAGPIFPRLPIEQPGRTIGVPRERRRVHPLIFWRNVRRTVH